MSAPTQSPARSRHVVPALLGAVLAATLLAAGSVVWLSPGPTSVVPAAVSESAHQPVPEPVPEPVLTAAVQAGPDVAASWDAPLTLTVTAGTLQTVTVLDPDGNNLDGAAVDSSTWRSTATSLLPGSTYHVSASVADEAGVRRAMLLAVQTTPAARVLHAVLSPGDGDVVGVGMPLIVTLDQPVRSPADRAALVQRLSVVTIPASSGGWRWMDDRELHYRGPSYWAANSRIAMSANLRRLQLSDGTWGSGTLTTHYRIGDAMISTVDVTAHVMTIRRNGVLLRTAKVSTGRDKYPTKGGVHIVLEKTLVKIMDSATVGIPRDSPDGYYERVPFSVRISYGGAFVHSANWSVRDQGVRNVSHGCVNMSPADAEWFYGLTRRGDVVNVIHAGVAPVLWDPGMSDWNIPYAQWAN